jgi:hypothetical protein
MIALHVTYIVATTVIDLSEWQKQFGARERIQMLHHVATWALLLLYTLPAEHTD